ncbi:hypothetical protein [Halomonas organivorans]|uniref:Uncharacterized protein n=1 Tax=Halomonas organivorans TaxID=257772 RepID=A0A7W5C075_9GAMM|nr:hypothetical protein [Halomonas organivorans]MBB3141938.1 hypothetical protein [Halomonas organivorans]
MDSIDLLPDPLHDGWIMLCKCGCKEIRPAAATTWMDFEVLALSEIRFQVTCLSCGGQAQLEVSKDEQDAPEEAGSG